jgi:hypothetical protein
MAAQRRRAPDWHLCWSGAVSAAWRVMDSNQRRTTPTVLQTDQAGPLTCRKRPVAPSGDPRTTRLTRRPRCPTWPPTRRSRPRMTGSGPQSPTTCWPLHRPSRAGRPSSQPVGGQVRAGWVGDPRAAQGRRERVRVAPVAVLRWYTHDPVCDRVAASDPPASAGVAAGWLCSSGTDQVAVLGHEMLEFGGHHGQLR